MCIRISRVALLIAVMIVIATEPSAQSPTDDAHTQTISLTEREAIAVVARRTIAYNNYDIEAFLATYDENVRIYEYPDELLGEGTDRMRRIFGPQFAENDGLIVVHGQHALESTVVSDETVTFYGNTEHNIGIYTVRDGYRDLANSRHILRS